MADKRNLEAIDDYINEVLNISIYIQDEDVDLFYRVNFISWNETMLQVDIGFEDPLLVSKSRYKDQLNITVIDEY